MARSKKPSRKPLIGSAFNADMTNEYGRVSSYLREIEYYRPRGFSKLRKEGLRVLREAFDDINGADDIDAFKGAVEDMLTEWARRVEGHDYIHFGPAEHSGDVGFWIDADEAIADADHVENDCDRDSEPEPDGFRGLLVRISDHGNVSAYRVTSRKRIELFSVV